MSDAMSSTVLSSGSIRTPWWPVAALVVVSAVAVSAAALDLMGQGPRSIVMLVVTVVSNIALVRLDRRRKATRRAAREARRLAGPR